MNSFSPKLNLQKDFNHRLCPTYYVIRRRLRKWQYARTWARLISETESLWRLEYRELRRIGAIELSQLLDEIPLGYRRRVDSWLIKYSAATRFNDNSKVIFINS